MITNPTIQDSEQTNGHDSGQTNGHSGLENSTINRIATLPVELRGLAVSFADMADQVQSLVNELQERVVKRTNDLQAVADVSSRVATITSPAELLQSVTDLTKAAFGLYHAHIYLLEGDQLVLAAGADEAGRTMLAQGHRIPLNSERSLVARAARSREGVLTNDVTQAPDFLANPLLPETRSEMAVPIVVGDQLIGVLDAQSEQVGRFTDEDVRVKSILAVQIGIAIQNARALEAIEKTANDLRRMSRTIEVTPEFVGFADGNTDIIYINPAGLKLTGVSPDKMPETSIADYHPAWVVDLILNEGVPTALEHGMWQRETALITREGEEIPVSQILLAHRDENGELQFISTIAHDIREQKRQQQEIQEAKEVSDLLYRAAERLSQATTPQQQLESIMEYAIKLNVSNGMLTYIDTDAAGVPEWGEVVSEWPSNTAIGSRYYFPEIPFAKLWMSTPDRPTLVGNVDTDLSPDEPARQIYLDLGIHATVVLPLVVNDRWIALVTFNWSTPQSFDERDFRLFTLLASQLANAVDAVRQFNRTAQQALELQTVADVSAAAATELNLERLLQTVTDLTKERFNLYHAHVYLLDEAGENLVLSAGAGEAGRAMKQRGHAIPMSRETSLVARAARSREGVVVNDVTQAPDFMANPLLPDTKSEMAVPMIVGDTLVGVLDVQADHADRFSNSDIQIQTTLARQIAVAVQNARAYEQAQKRLKQLEASAKITELVRTADDMESTTETFLEILLDVLNADSAVISYFEQNTQTWHGFVGVGEGLTRELVKTFVDEGPRYPHGLEVLQTGKIVTIDDVRTYPNFPMDFVENLGIKSVVTLPLSQAGKVVAVVFINITREYHHFTNEEVNLLYALIGQMNNGIEQIRTKNELEASEQRFREIAATMPGAIFQFTVHDGVWKVPFISDGVERMFGITAQNFMDDLNSFIAMIHPDDLSEYIASVTRAVETLEPWDYMGRIIHPDGQIVWWHGMSTPSRTASGEIVFNGVLFDITESKKQEEVIRASQEQLQSVLDNTTAVIYIKDKAGRYLRINKAYEALIHLSSEAMIGKTDYDLFPQEFADRFWHVDQQVIETGNVVELEETVIFDGMQRNYVSIKFPLHDAAGEIYAMCGISTDITERKQQEEAILEAKAETDILYQASQKIAHATTPQEQLEATLDYAREIGATSANLVYLDLDESGQPIWSEFVAIWEQEGVVTGTTVGGRYYLPELPFARLWMANPDRPTLINNTMEIEDPATRALYETTGIKATVYLPLMVNKRWVGLVLFNWSESREFSERDVRIFTQIAAQTANAVDAVRQFNRTAQQALELRTVADVSAAAATELNLERLLQTVTDLTKERFNLYHAHVYLLDEAGENLVLSAGAGEAGRTMKQRGHAIPMSRETSLVARAARSREGVVVNDVTQAPDFMANPLLPDTKSEMAVPMIVGDTLVGVLDVQADKVDRFTDDDVHVQTTLARQIAVAVQNARAFERTEQDRRLLASVIDSTPDWIFVKDRNYRYVLTNKAFAQWYGNRTPEEMVGKTDYDLGTPAYLIEGNPEKGISGFLTDDRAVIEQGIVIENPNDVVNFADGTLHIQETRKMPLRDSAGNVVAIIGMSRDVTQQRELDKAREQLLKAAEEQAARERETAERLREVDRLKSQFLANMSHELRTPLNSIIGYAEVLLDGDDGELSPDATEDITIIHNSGKHLLWIINDILDLAKIESGQMQMNFSDIDLGKFLEEIAQAGQVLVKEKPVTLELLGESKDLHIQADPVRLRQIVFNLVSNAAKFTEQGNITVQYGLKEDGFAYVSVKDTGIGIAHEDFEAVFQQFRQVDGSTTRRAGGTGLGLTITRHLVQMHGGKIWVESEPGIGSTFTFTIPLRQAEQV